MPMRSLLLGSPEQPVAEIMVREVVALPARTTMAEACESFIRHRFLAIPVVDEERRLLGVVDVELYIDEIGALQEGGCATTCSSSSASTPTGRGTVRRWAPSANA